MSAKGHPKFPTRGHRKLPTPWFSRQGLGRLNKAGLQLLLETVGVALDVHSDRMMEQAIQVAAAITRSSKTSPQLLKLRLLVRIIGPRS